MKKIKLFIFVLILNFSFFKLLYSNEISTKMIANNCNGCHGNNNPNSEVIPNISNLNKEMFIKKMLEYKKSNSNSIMVRLTKVLNEVDINNLADFYFSNE